MEYEAAPLKKIRGEGSLRSDETDVILVRIECTEFYTDANCV